MTLQDRNRVVERLRRLEDDLSSEKAEAALEKTKSLDLVLSEVAN
ncbi:MAG: hypothetical protein WEB60_10430 [Terrimicrobiaceae bacterium]